MKDQLTNPLPVHWFARLLALLLTLAGLGVILFAVWGLVVGRKSEWNAIELLGIVPVGLLMFGVCGWIVVFGRVAPRVGPDPDPVSIRVPTLVRVWAGAICLLSPFFVLSRIHDYSGESWFGIAINLVLVAYLFFVLVRISIGGYWPDAALRFSRRANMTWHELDADTRREHEHRRRF